MVGVIQKATQGVGYVDPTWTKHRAGALAAGLLFGSYHFLTGSASGADQAAFFLRTVGPHPGELLALDFEFNPEGPSATLTHAADFVDSVRATVPGVWPVFYSGGYLKDLLRGVAAPASLTGCPLWLAQYSSVAVLPAGWARWALWQYADGHVVSAPPVPGIGLCDRDRFNGTVEELGAFWGAHSPTAPPPT
jgi:lysozyme